MINPVGTKIDGSGDVGIPVSADGKKVPVDIGSATVEIDTTGLATSAKQDTGNTSLASIDTKTPTKGTAAMAGSSPVTIATNDTVMSELLTDTDNLATIATNTTGAATSAKQDTGNTSLASIKTDLDTIAASGAGSKVAGQATMANSAPVAIASDQSAIPNVVVTSTDTGQNLSLSDTNSHQFASAACKVGVMLSCPLGNSAAVYVGLASGVTSGNTGKGIELQPGDREFFPLGVGNANQLFAITGTATQNVHALAI